MRVAAGDVGTVLYLVLQLDPLLHTQGLAKLLKVCLIQWVLFCHIASAWALGYLLRLLSVNSYILAQSRGVTRAR